ncbi:hypothetical protein ACTFIU_004081, partial [Dictyostelium citrinum]
QVKV